MPAWPAPEENGEYLVTYIKRQLDLAQTLRSRSVLLLGPRQTGKSTYLRHQLPRVPDFVFNLLDQKTFLELSANATRMRELILASQIVRPLVVVDEIQKLPLLTDEIQLLMEEHGVTFVLTGSSARKLKGQGVNLLGGRGRDRSFHPFVYVEVKNHDFTLQKCFFQGMIPNHFFSDSPNEDLAAYCGRYLSEEIQAEALTRNLAGFSRFLTFAAQCNGQLINFTNLANDSGLPRTTVQNYFQILQDTLIARPLEPFSTKLIRKSLTVSKFYFFDPGVVRFLRKLGQIAPQGRDFGEFFEHFIYCELSAYKSYFMPTADLNYWRSKSGLEVDFVLDNRIAVEVKSSSNIQKKHLSGLRALKEEDTKIERWIVVSQEERPRLLEDGILVLPWADFLEELWKGNFTQSEN
jgi:uncharacterized protein